MRGVSMSLLTNAMSKLIDVRANVHIFEDNRFDFSDIIDLYFNINNTILHFYCSHDGETLVMDNVFSKKCTNMGEYGNIEHINLTNHPIFNTVIGKKISHCHLIKSTHRLCGIIINFDNQHRVIIANLGDDFFVGNELPSLFNGGDYTIELCHTLRCT